jgi:iron-sulfur cluster repair protein YtfE (RIC family)
VIRAADRAAWRHHPHAGGPAAMLLAIHDQFRVAAERLRFLAAKSPQPDRGWLARGFEPLARTLHHHHHAEEAMLFPFVAERAGVAPDRLVDDHRALTRAIEVVEESLSRHGREEPPLPAIEALEHMLITHLDREERLVVPLLLELAPAEAWAAIRDPCAPSSFSTIRRPAVWSPLIL